MKFYLFWDKFCGFLNNKIGKALDSFFFPRTNLTNFVTIFQIFFVVFPIGKHLGKKKFLP
jgi:hypothetical protein